MRRPADIEWIYSTIARMRKIIPGLAIRTTFIVGYPNETEERFRTLLEFIKGMRFDRIGGFKFSYEKGTASESLGDPISPELKEERFQRLMSLQQEISLQINQTFIGTQLEMLVEGIDESKNISLGRSYRDAPEIDGLILAEGKADIGDIVKVRISGAMTYDLSGVIVEKNKGITQK